LGFQTARWKGFSVCPVGRQGGARSRWPRHGRSWLKRWSGYNRIKGRGIETAQDKPRGRLRAGGQAPPPEFAVERTDPSRRTKTKTGSPAGEVTRRGDGARRLAVTPGELFARALLVGEQRGSLGLRSTLAPWLMRWSRERRGLRHVRGRLSPSSVRRARTRTRVQ